MTGQLILMLRSRIPLTELPASLSPVKIGGHIELNERVDCNYYKGLRGSIIDETDA